MRLDGLKDIFGSFRSFAADTTFVVFFLGLESGRTLQNFSFDTLLLLVTMLIVTVLPYFLPSEFDRPNFAKWMAGRGLIAVFSILVGVILSRTYGTVLPESFRYLPLTLLILAAMASCFTQFYGLMRLRPAK